jgi:hypothetical protein
VFVQGWRQIAIGLLMLGVAPAIVAAMPWWASPTYTRAFPQIWTAITVAKAALDLVAHAAVATILTGVALDVLSAPGGPAMQQPRRLAAGFATAISLGLFVNWATLVSPIAAVYAPMDDVRLMLMLSVPISLAVSVAAAGIAVPVAIAAEASVGAAVAESFRLLHGLRWRIVSLCFAYIVLLWATQYAALLSLASLHVPYLVPGPGRAAIGIVGLLSGALLDLAFAAFFVQARRLADGPSADELRDVFK